MLVEWEFPNAIAESARRTAKLKGQHADRIEIREPGDKWPPFHRVSSRERCSGASNLRIHEGTFVTQGERRFFDPFCRTCGYLVDAG